MYCPTIKRLPDRSFCRVCGAEQALRARQGLPGLQRYVVSAQTQRLAALVQGYFRTQPVKAESFKPTPEHIEQLRALGYVQ